MTLTRPGQRNQAGDSNALFLRKFGGEVLTAFHGANVFMSRHTVRTIESGSSAQFPATWKATARYHTPGTALTGQNIGHNERIITIDDLLVADTFIYRLDEAKNHYDVRSIYSKECGNALSRTFDRNVARVGILAARASATVSGGNGGTQLVATGSRTNATALINAAFDAAQALDEKDVPDTERCLFVKPDQYYMLVNSDSKLISTDYNPGGNGSVARGKVHYVAGLEIVKTNNLPVTDESLDTSIASGYRGNFANTTALVMHRTAVGTVKLLDLAVEMEYLIQYQGHLAVAKYAVGHGILRPECSVEITNA